MHTTSATSTSDHAAALVLAARAVQPEAKSFGDDVNEGYLLLHTAFTEALRDPAVTDPASLTQALRDRTRALAGWRALDGV